MSDRIGLAPMHILAPPPGRDCIAAGPIDLSIDWREAMTAYDYRLTLVHSRLDHEIRREQACLAPDACRVQRLKKLKLAIKDRLQQMRKAQWRSCA
jgi:hypothetical protein